MVNSPHAKILVRVRVRMWRIPCDNFTFKWFGVWHSITTWQVHCEPEFYYRLSEQIYQKMYQSKQVTHCRFTCLMSLSYNIIIFTIYHLSVRTKLQNIEARMIKAINMKAHYKKIDTGTAYTAATIRQASKSGYVMGTWWRQEKKRTPKEDLATNIPGRFTGDASQLEWCSQSG